MLDDFLSSPAREVAAAVAVVVFSVWFTRRRRPNEENKRPVFRSISHEAGQKVRSLDSIWLSESRSNLGYITGLLVLEKMSLEEMREAWKRALYERNEHGELKYSRMQLMPDHDGIWRQDEQFCVERHVVAARHPQPKNWEELRTLLAEKIATCPPYDRPYWQVEIVENFESTNMTAMILRIQHCYADGTALVEFLHSFFDQPEQHHHHTDPSSSAVAAAKNTNKNVEADSSSTPGTPAITVSNQVLSPTSPSPCCCDGGRPSSSSSSSSSAAASASSSASSTISSLCSAALTSASSSSYTSPPTFFGEQRARFLVNVIALILTPFSMIALAFQRKDSSCLHGRVLSGGKSVALLTSDFDLNEVKKIKDELGVTVNDVMCGIVAGALGKLANRQEEAKTPRKIEKKKEDEGWFSFLSSSKCKRFKQVRFLSASIPVNVRAAGSPVQMQNEFSIIRFFLPADESDPIKRIEKIRSASLGLKRSVAPLAMMFAMRALKILPGAATSALLDFYANKSTLVLTNVRCPDTSKILGKSLIRASFWVPQRASIGVGVSIFSVGDKIGLGVAVDKEIATDAMEIETLFQMEFDELKERVLNNKTHKKKNK